MNRPLAAHEVSAFNTAAASENKIHDDAIARRFGFRGGLVPGVEVYAYMAHMPVERWGRAWLAGGVAECRFLKPVYTGALARVTAAEEDDQLALAIESAGQLCATGRAFMPSDRRGRPVIDSLPLGVPPVERPRASEISLASGRALGIRPTVIDRAALSSYLDEIRETEPIYRAEQLVHPGQILRLANQALVQNVALGPWIHVGSKVRHHAVARLGEELSLRARITANTVSSKGHAVVEFDAIVVAERDRCIGEITHAAIWRPRQLAEAAQGSAAAARGAQT